jgi:maltoporin
MRPPSPLSLVALALLAILGQAPAAEPLSPEVQRVLDAYERRIEQLERRIAELEKTPRPPAASPAANPVAREADAADRDRAAALQARARASFADTTETRDRAVARRAESLVNQRIEQILYDFVDISGYFRAGYGVNNHGSIQTPFQAPDAPAKFRLGNETENYGELAFSKTWYEPGIFSRFQPATATHPGGALAKFQLRLAFYEPYDGGDFQVSMPELWASLGNLVTAQPELKFWAGNRFYRRHDIHINDFYFYNMSGRGGGFEDLDLGFGKLALAWIGNSSQGATFADLLQPDPANEGGFAKRSVDLRLYDVRLPLGTGEFGAAYSRSQGGSDADGNSVDGADGWAVHFVHTAEKFLDPNSINKFSLQYGVGAARTFTSGFETFSDPRGVFIRPEEEGSWRFRATEHFVIQPHPNFSVGAAAVYQYTDYDNADGQVQWASVGARPIFHFNDHFNVALEAGVDWTDNSANGTSDFLFKLTLAPQLQLGGGFLDRPVLRAFVTWAKWGNDFVGRIGGADYAQDDYGLVWGVQMETWW